MNLRQLRYREPSTNADVDRGVFRGFCTRLKQL
jgi:hypothetical protein